MRLRPRETRLLSSSSWAMTSLRYRGSVVAVYSNAKILCSSVIFLTLGSPNICNYGGVSKVLKVLCSREEGNMHNATFFSIPLALFSLAIGTAQAEVCYRLNPFVDVLRLSQTTFVEPSTGGSHAVVSGNWIAHGFYTLPVVGSLELDSGSTTVTRLGIHGTQKTANFFAGHSNCILDGTPGGSWFLSCNGRVDGIFNNSGPTLSPVSCVGLPASLAQEAGPEARAAGTAGR